MTHNRNWPVYSLGQALSRLPARARNKYRALQALVDDARALQGASQERGKGLDETIYHLEMRLDRLDPRGEKDEIKAVKEELEAAKQALNTLTEQRDKRNAARANAEQVLAQLQPFVMALTDVDRRHQVGRLRPVTEANYKLKKGETIIDAVERLRSEIGRIQSEIGRLRQAPLPPNEIKNKIRYEVDKLAQAGAPTLRVDGGKVNLTFPDMVLFSEGAKMAPEKSATQLMAWMFRDELLDRLLEGVDNIEGGIPLSERAPREAELRTRMLTLEHEEEHFVEQAQAAGLECHRRVSASPFALLGIEGTPIEAEADEMEAAE